MFPGKLTMQNSVSRRRFLKTTAISFTAVTATVIGAGCSPQTEAASSGKANEIETPSFQYGNLDMNEKRILVAYATRTGSTVDVASAIGETLAGRGFSVDVKPMKEHPSVQGYDALLLGSAINGAHWLPEAVQFVKGNQAALKLVPVALFCVHIMNLGSDERSKKKRLSYLDEVRALVHPTDEAFFAGIGMDPEEESGFVRWVYRTFKIGPEGDCRDWGKIKAWAKELAIHQ